MGIRSKLLLFATVVAVPLALLGVIDLRGMWRVSRTQLNESVKQQAELAAVAYERWVDAQRQPLTTVAARAAGNKQDIPALKSELTYIAKTSPHWIDIRIISNSGDTIIAEPADREPPPPALIEHLLAETRNNPAGVVVSDRTRDEFRPTLAIAVPIEDDGVVMARIDAAAINELFRDIHLYEQSVIAVFDERRRVLYRRQTTPAPIDREVNRSPLFAALENQRVAVVQLQSPYDGIDRVYGLAETGKTRSVVVVGIPSEILYQPASRRLMLYVYFSLAVLTLAVGAAFLMARTIAQPIQKLRAAAQELGAGDLSARAPLKAGGEIGELGATFNAMAHSIAVREEALRELDRLKSEFVSSVSHELRTPLTTIKTLTHVLQQNGQSEEMQREYLETIATECDRQIDLVLNLLDLSRIESGAYKVKPDQVNVSEVVLICLGREKHAAESHEQVLISNLPSDLPLVRADKTALRRALCSLLENAIKYTPEGGTITVSATASKNEVAISVEDNGCGIHSDDLPFIFDKFVRGRPAQRLGRDGQEVERPGVGLGLYLARNIIEQMEGRIEVDSDKEGTVFTVYLPVFVNEGLQEGVEIEAVTGS